MKKKEKKNKNVEKIFKSKLMFIKLSTLFLGIGLLLQFSTLQAQTNTVTINKKNVAIEDILKEIQKQTGLDYFLNHEEIPNGTKTSVEIRNGSIKGALEQCFKDLDLTYKIIDNVIVVTPQKKSSVPNNENDLKQTIKGSIYDIESQIPLIGATIIIKETDPIIGTTTDVDGDFKIENVSLGRYTIEFSYVGYEPYFAREVLVSSGKEVVLNVGLKESITQLEEIQVKAHSNKDQPINSMATLSARQISMEEANRYAGGVDDPARLVTSAAGATFANVRSNGIVIRGNAPKGLLWRMEGVQIPNPSHFADFISLGGGGITALSSQTMANSDFYTGAFPAEYGNAFSGVFDINMRTGNTEKREHTFQAGIIGIDFASEGPFVKGKRSSYLFNYRYSTLGLLAPLLPKEMGIISYQDLSFKLNFPTRKMGTISFWGIGSFDMQLHRAEKDSLEWNTSDDRKEYTAKFTMGALGINHKIVLDEKTYMHTTIASTGNGFNWLQKRYSNELVLQPKTDFHDLKWKYTLTSFINHKFNKSHTNKTGFIIDRFYYDINNKDAEEYGETMRTYISDKGSSNLLHFYSQSKLGLGENISMNIGFHAQYFTLNDHYIIEPRFGIRWNFLPRQTLSFAYGHHSQLENLSLYLARQETATGAIMPNTYLDFEKAHHIVLGYTVKLSENLVFTMEPYYQKLYDIPVVPNSYISTINIDDIWSFNDSLVNAGTGKNMGIDFTLERYLKKGVYYVISASLFESKYTGGDNIERNTRYNRNYVLNILGGKEWFTGKNQNNIFGANVRFSYIGGDRIIPINLSQSLEQKTVVEDTYNAYSKQLPAAPILSFSFSYRINKPNHSSIWSLQFVNALAHKEFQEYEYNTETNSIEESKDLIVIGNISYKIEF